MMMKILCVNMLIVIAAMSSVRTQDIEPQYIPRPSTTEGPEKESAVTVTENSDNIPTTTESDTYTQTDLISTVTTATEADDTTTEVIRTTTDVIPKDTTTDIVTTRIEAEDTTTEAVRTTTDVIPTNVPTTNISPERVPSPTPEETPSLGGGAWNCRIMLISETPYYNWILGVFIVPKTCSYCCTLGCYQKCVEIKPFYCID